MKQSGKARAIDRYSLLEPNLKNLGAGAGRGGAASVLHVDFNDFNIDILFCFCSNFSL